jgi:hypothetical protein
MPTPMSQPGDVKGALAAFAPTHARRRLQPEERLMLVVLEHAYADATLRAEGPAAEQIRAAARAWMLSAEEQWLLSFLRICGHFGIDAQAVRAAARATGEKSTRLGGRPGENVIERSARRHLAPPSWFRRVG